MILVRNSILPSRLSISVLRILVARKLGFFKLSDNFHILWLTTLDDKKLDKIKNQNHLADL